MEAHLRGDDVAHCLQKAFGIGNLPNHVALDDQVLFVSGQELRWARIVHHEPFLKTQQGFHGPLEMEPWLDGIPHGLAEESDDRRLCLRNHEEAVPEQDHTQPARDHIVHGWPTSCAGDFTPPDISFRRDHVAGKLHASLPDLLRLTIDLDEFCPQDIASLLDLRF